MRSIAAYAQGNVYVSDTLTLGGRRTNDRKRGSYSQVSSPFAQTIRAPEALTYPGLSEGRFTYRVSLNYKPADDVMLFATHSTGYKSGGYNSGGGVRSLSTVDPQGKLIATRRVFDRETVKNYELSVKSSWLDRALTANLALYRMDIAGFQDRAFDGVSFVVRNAGNLRQQGFELDLVLAPSDRFSLSNPLPSARGVSAARRRARPQQWRLSGKHGQPHSRQRTSDLWRQRHVPILNGYGGVPSSEGRRRWLLADHR